MFSEVYGSYYQVVAAILEEAVAGTLSEQALQRIVHEKAFAESVFSIPSALRSGEWSLLDGAGKTPLRHKPTLPLTILEKRWLKALLSDPRIRLFSPSMVGLEDVEPLYPQDAFVYFDRCTDGDPYEAPQYVAHFRTILQALRENRMLRIRFQDRAGTGHTWRCTPYRLEYSSKDDKFRLITVLEHDTYTVGVAHITSCELLDSDCGNAFPQRDNTRLLELELTDERSALERAMLHFSPLKKETRRLDDGRYRISLQYDQDEEAEMLIRVLSFGPMLRVAYPEHFARALRERIEKQPPCSPGP